jgi:hypothetical protein
MPQVGDRRQPDHLSGQGPRPAGVGKVDCSACQRPMDCSIGLKVSKAPSASASLPDWVRAATNDELAPADLAPPRSPAPGLVVLEGQGDGGAPGAT